MTVVLTLVQTKQIRINIHKRNNTMNHLEIVFVDSRKKGTSFVYKRRKAKWIGHILPRDCFLKWLLKERYRE
jgi:hypothetical protein